MVRNVQKNVGNVGNDTILSNQIDNFKQVNNLLFLCNEVKLMNKINLKGITSEAVTGVLILVVALVNAVLQMFGVDTLPIDDENISAIVSTVFLIVTALYNTWKNRNVTTISQEVQQIADAVRNGEILEDDVKELISKIKTK